MKSNIIFTTLLSICIVTNTFSQDKKRLKIVEKSINNKSFEIYKDTVFHSGTAKYVLKKVEKKSAFTSNRLGYRDLCDLRGNMLCQINLYHEQIIPFAKSTSFVFWIKFKGTDEDIRFTNKESNDELGLIKYLTESDIVSEKGLNKAKVAEFVFDHKEIKFACGIRNECTSPNVKVEVKNKNGEIVDKLLPTRTGEMIALAKGDKLYLYVGID